MNEWRASELDLAGTFDGDRVLFREDVDTVSDYEPHDRVWSRYCEMSEQLQERGLRPHHVYLEHDCISGEIILAEQS